MSLVRRGEICECGRKKLPIERGCPVCLRIESQQRQFSKAQVGGPKRKNYYILRNGGMSHKAWSSYVDDLGPTNVVGDSLKFLDQQLNSVTINYDAT